MPVHRTVAANIWKSYLIRMLFWMHFVAAVIVPFYTQWGHLPFSRILLINAWFMLWMFMFEVPTGTVADVLGRKPSLFMGAVISILGTLVYVSRPSFYIFLLAELILACGYSLISGAEEALAYDSLLMLNREAESKKVLARMESFKLTGIIIGALAGGVIAKYFGLRMPMLMQAVPLLAAALLILSLKEPVRHDGHKKPPYLDLLKAGWRQFRSNRVIRILMLDMVAVGAWVWLIIWFYQQLLKLAHVDIVWFGLVHTLMCVAQIMVLESVRKLETFLGGKRSLLMVLALVSGVGFILLGFLKNPWLIAAVIVVTSGFGLARGPLFINYLNKFISSDKRAIMLSMVSMLRTLTIVMVNILAGLAADHSITLTMVGVGVAIIVLVTVSKVREDHLLD